MSEISFSDSDDSFSAEEKLWNKFQELKKQQEQERANLRDKKYEEIFTEKKASIFHLPGLYMVKFTSKKIHFVQQPSLIYKDISTKYKYDCVFKYLHRYKKWILKREPIGAKPLYKAILHDVCIDDDVEKFFLLIKTIYAFINEVAEEIITRRQRKYIQFKSGLLTWRDMDSEDEEVYLTKKEAKEVRKKKNALHKRMEWPNPEDNPNITITDRKLRPNRGQYP